MQPVNPDLVERVKELKTLAPNMTYSQMGKALNETKDTIQKIGKKLELATVPPPELPEPLTHEGDMILVADVHVPYTKKNLVEEVLKRGKRMKIKKLGVIGDIFQQDMFGRYAQLTWGKSFGKECAMTRAMLSYWMTWFDEVDIIRGNHDERVVAAMNAQMSMESLVDLIAPDGKRAQIRSSIHTKMFALSGGQKWMLAHWKSFSKNPLVRAAELARKYRCNVLDAHQHHGAVGCVEGFTIADIPCLADMNLTPYVYLDVSTLDDWENGFASLVDGHIDVYVERGLFGLK